ncbi:MAG: hypothetical protein UBAL2_86920217 [Leptospirillum rubarum]|uniref:Uncharacterized protein n=1 Tax=Leptospirillum sp. Group II '5-way CG' TaxID=419541 RepID=B6AP77_9BACT|nr:MAG: hypothetical protein UBAL2_86920217 [Leptospirillum rubarum]EDZ39063.1 MAG: Hypothetical protein CGL2_08228004 [Leptospirillum sp. Group II '5-way CG']
MKINPDNVSDPVYAYLDLGDDHVDLVTHAAAKALSELYRGTYEYKELPDGWIGFRVSIDPSRIKTTVDRHFASKSMLVSFERNEFNFHSPEQEAK